MAERLSSKSQKRLARSRQNYLNNFGGNAAVLNPAPKLWRDGRAVECGGLENRYPTRIGGSNPPLSARHQKWRGGPPNLPKEDLVLKWR